jgi:glycosyltransferase involved in cell wall biosynthesis
LKIGYDAQAIVAQDKGGGKGRQLRNLLGKHISTFVGFAPSGPPVPAIPVKRGGPAKYLVWQQTTLNFMIRNAGLDVFLAPYNTAPLLLPSRTKLILVLHDLIPLLDFPNVRLRLRILLSIWRFEIPRSVKRAHIILTVSNFSRDEILQRYPSKRVIVIPCTIPEDWFDPRQVVPIAHRGRYIFLATSIEPHRNLERALQAFKIYVERAGKNAVSLRIAGVSKHRTLLGAMIERHGLQGKVVLESYLSEQEMQTRIRNAAAVYMPSLIEGFGIPILEGLATGTPVLCSNRSSMPEVGGDAVALFNPEDPHEIASTLQDVLSSPARRQQMAEAGLDRAKKFHPTIVARLAEEFWKMLESELAK